MRIFITLFLLLVICSPASFSFGGQFDQDTFHTSAGDLAISFIGHGTLMMQFKGKVLHVDPFSKLADYGKMPDADIILLTHHHRDHLDLKALEQIRTEKTDIILTAKSAEKVSGGEVLRNGESRTVQGIKIEAVPAYNLIHRRDNGQLFHPKGEGNGYVLTFGDTRVYIAGDTENIPEMQKLSAIDIAFLPMNLPYTMTPEMVADAARAFWPKVLYPYHYGETDTARILTLIQDTDNVEVRLRNMK